MTKLYDESGFMGPAHPDAFVDFPPPTKPGDEDPGWIPLSEQVVCHVCKGYGGWNLKLNAYSLHGREDTPGNRYLYSNFRTTCGQCAGWGIVRAGTLDQTCPGHNMKHVRNKGRCLNEYKCEVCGKTEIVDSSD